MTLLLAILAAMVAVLLVALALNWRHSARPLDTEHQERWFLRHSPGPLQRMLRGADRRVAGSSLVIVLLVVITVAAAVLGWILSTVDHGTGFARWDMSAAEWGAARASKRTTDTLKAFSLFGATGYVIPLMGVIGLYYWIRYRRPAIFGYLAMVGLGILLVNNTLKWIVDRDRPPVPHLMQAGGTSFPSGHTAASAACWAGIAFVLSRRRHWHTRATLAALAAAITTAVAASRVLLGVHWLTDVIAGAVTGWAWFTVSTLVFGGRLMRFGEPALRATHDQVTPLEPEELIEELEEEKHA